MRIRVYGDPKAQPRGRAFAMKTKGGKVSARVYNPKTAEGWKSLLAVAARPLTPAEPMVGPVRLKCNFIFPRPKAHFVSGDRSRPLKKVSPFWHTIKPDVDNLSKPIMDTLKTLGFYHDDSQICTLITSKAYGTDPGVDIEISVIPIQ